MFNWNFRLVLISVEIDALIVVLMFWGIYDAYIVLDWSSIFDGFG